MNLKIGGIYRLDRTRFHRGFGDIELLLFTVRVLAYDKYEVFVDVIPKSESDWQLNKKHKKLFWFGKFSMKSFDEDAKEIGFSELSDELKEYYRTDLPFRISRLKEVSWNDCLFSSVVKMNEFVQVNTSDEWEKQQIKSKNIFLVASKNNGKYEGPVLVEAENKVSFSASEILWKTSQLQRKPSSKASSGVGIFRGGSKGGIPFYYIGDYLGNSKYLKELEESGICTNL